MKLKITLETFQDGTHRLTSRVADDEFELNCVDKVDNSLAQQIQEYAELMEIIRKEVKAYFSNNPKAAIVSSNEPG